MPTLESHHGYYLWHYVPSLPAAIVFAILFSGATGAHMWKMIRAKTWFCLPFVIGGFFEIIGYAGRAASYSMTGELAPYITQSIFLLLAPVLFAASLYMTLGRLIRRVQGDSCSIIPPGWLTKIFVFGDVFSFLVQGSGAGLMASGSASSMKNGENIVVAGLVLQILMFGLFVLTGAIFNVRFRKLAPTARQTDIPWQSTLYMLYVTSAFIMLRNIFRVVEYASGQDKYPLQNEWLVYVFDGVLMLFTMMWFFFRYPSHTKPILHGRNQSEERSGKA